MLNLVIKMIFCRWWDSPLDLILMVLCLRVAKNSLSHRNSFRISYRFCSQSSMRVARHRDGKWSHHFPSRTRFPPGFRTNARLRIKFTVRFRKMYLRKTEKPLDSICRQSCLGKFKDSLQAPSGLWIQWFCCLCERFNKVPCRIQCNT